MADDIVGAAASYAASRLVESFARDTDPSFDVVQQHKASDAAYFNEPRLKQFVEADEVGTRPLPKEVQEYMATVTRPVRLGVWPEIRRAWAILDTRFVVWHYVQEGDVCRLPADAVTASSVADEFAIDQRILCANLVVPRPGAFPGSVKVSPPPRAAQEPVCHCSYERSTS
jgi:hypothetical protein